MSPHTDAGAFTIRLEARPADDSHDWVEICPAQLQWMAKEGNQVRAIEVAASHGSAGGERSEVRTTEPVACRWRHVNDETNTWHYQSGIANGHNEYIEVQPLYASVALGGSGSEAMGRAFYLARYENDGAKWEANDHKVLWIRMAQRYHEILGAAQAQPKCTHPNKFGSGTCSTDGSGSFDWHCQACGASGHDKWGPRLPSADQRCPECEANGLCARHAIPSAHRGGEA